MKTQLSDLKRKLNEIQWVMKQYDINQIPYDYTYKRLDNEAMNIISTINNIR